MIKEKIQNLIKTLFIYGKDKLIVLVSDWDAYLPEPERQRRNNFDLYNCVIQMYVNRVETVFNYAIKARKIPQASLDFLTKEGYIKDGKVCLSKKWISVRADIKNYGTTFAKAITAAEEWGMVPEILYDWNEDEDTWEEYYDDKEYTEELKRLGQRFLEHFDIVDYYVYGKDEMEKALKESPLGIVVFAWLTNANNEHYKPNGYPTNHGTVLLNYNKRKVFDSYPPFIKTLAWDNMPTWGLASYIFFLKEYMDTEQYVKDNDLKWVQNKKTGQFGRIMRGALYTVASNDRGTLILLDDKVRTSGMRISDEVWNTLTKIKF